MLNGLEAAELKKSQLESGTRVDAELYRKAYMDVEGRLKQKPYVSLESQARAIKKGIFDIKADCYAESGIPFVRISNLKNMVMDEGEVIYIPLEEHLKNSETALKRNDVVLSKTAYPAASLVTFEECNTSQDTVAIKLKKGAEVNSHYLVTFLNTSYGLSQMQRWFTGNIQMHLNLSDCKRLRVPLFSETFQTKVREVFDKGIQARETSRRVFTNAENLLLDKLGFENLQVSEESVSVKSFKESLSMTGRLDAEYYHPEKQFMQAQLEGLPGKSIGHHVVHVNELFVPSNSGVGETVQNYDLEAALNFFIGDVKPTSAIELGSTKKRIKRGDVIISRLRSYLREIAMVDTDADANCVGSSEFIVLRPTSPTLSAELLTVYLRSLPVQIILKWSQDGSNHPRFRVEELLSIKMPECILSAQQEIKELVKAAIVTHRESEHLLYTAKRGVEIAIEQDEAAALRWMEEQVERHGREEV